MRQLDNSVMKVDTDPDIFQLEMNQLRDKPIDQDEVVCTEDLTTVTLDALPAENYMAIKLGTM